MVASVSMGKKDGVGGFLIDRIDGAVMRSWVDDHAKFPFNGVDRDATDRQLAVAMSLHFREKETPDDEMLECDVCQGMAPESLDACPFCGSIGEPPKDVAPTEAATHDVTPPPAEAAAPKKKAKKGTKKKNKDEPPAAGVVVEESNMQTQTNGKAKTNGKGTHVESNLVQVKGTGAPLAESKATVKTLDRLVSEAKTFQGASFDNYVGFGSRIAEIHDKRLWQLRMNENGKAQYASFDAFVHHEFKITPQYATTLMKHGREFNAEDQRVLGRSKMTLLLQAPPADRAALKEAAKKGLTKRELADRVKTSRDKAGYKGDSPQQQRASLSAKNKKKKSAAANVPAPKVTAIANLDGKKTIKLYQRPPTLRNLNLDDLKRAKQISDKPFGIIELANEGRLLVEVKKNTEGLLTLTYEFQRNT